MSNTEGDSGKTAVIKTAAFNSMACFTLFLNCSHIPREGLLIILLLRGVKSKRGAGESLRISIRGVLRPRWGVTIHPPPVSNFSDQRRNS